MKFKYFPKHSCFFFVVFFTEQAIFNTTFLKTLVFFKNINYSCVHTMTELEKKNKT